MIRGLVTLTLLCVALLLNACGGASGRQGGDLFVTGVGPSTALNGGDVATFIMTVRNASEFTAEDVIIKNVASQMAQATLVITCTASGGAVCPSPTGTTMTVPLFPGNASLVFQVSGPTVLGASGNVSNTMAVTVGSGDPDNSNNTVTINGSVFSNDVSVVVTAPTGPLLDGPATFSVVIANDGPNDARDVLLEASASANVALVPANITCTANPNTGANQTPLAAIPVLQPDGTLISSLIPPGGSLSCAVPVVVAQATNGFAILTVQSTTVGDSRAGNNSSTASVSATLVNDLGVTVTAPPGPLLNSAATFNAVISNAGPSTAQGVVITNTTSNGLTLAGAIVCTPTGGASTTTLQSDGRLLAASMPANSKLTCTVPTTVSTGTNGLVSNTVSVSTTDDPRPSNNTAQAAVQATLVNNVGVTANATPTPSVPGGGSTSLSFVIGNSGPGPAFNVALSNLLTGAISYSNISDPISCTFAAPSTSVPPAKFTASGNVGSGTVAVIALGDQLTCVVPITVNAGANGTVTSTLSAAAPFDTLNINNAANASTTASSADLGVSQTGSSTVAAGATTNFVASVANPRVQGQTSPANSVTLTWAYTTPPGNVTVNPPTCVALGGAICPVPLVRNVPIAVSNGLLNGASLQFTFSAESASTSDRGVITNTLSVTSTGDPNTANNSKTTSTTIVNPNNGSYTAVAADGKTYTMSIDFDGSAGGSPSYTMSGAPTPNTIAFKADTSRAREYVATNDNELRFRLAQDLIVGNHRFSGGVLPFVAARSFVGSVAQIAGTYNLAMRDVPVSGSSSTHAGSALASGNTLSICQSDTAEVTTVGNCAVGDLKTYTLTVSNNVFMGLSSGGETLPFYVVNTGAAKVLLSAKTVTDSSQQVTNRQFRLGLIDSQVGLATDLLRGPSSEPDWLEITLVNGSPATYSATGAGATDSFALNVINTNRGPFNMFKGLSTVHGNGQVYLMQSVPLTAVFGSSNVGGAGASGLLQIALP